MKSGWEHFSHTADMGIRGFGVSKEDAFVQAALAMMAVSVDLESIKQSEKVNIECQQDDEELLFIEFLNKIIYEISNRKMLFSRFDIKIEDDKLTGQAIGEKIDIKRHKPAVEIKGATYSGLKVTQQQDGTWMAQCIIDI